MAPIMMTGRNSAIMDVKRRNGVSLCTLRCLQAALILCAVALSGCQRHCLRDQQCPPATGFCGDDAPSVILFSETPGTRESATASLAEAKRLAAAQDAACVDLYYRAALQAGRRLEVSPFPPRDNPYDQRTWEVYQQSLVGLIETGQRYGRLDPRGRLLIAAGGGWRVVPINYHGFAWKPSDFCELILADDRSHSGLGVVYRSPGLGAALVAVRHASCDEPFHQVNQPFAVTAVLRSTPSLEAAVSGDGFPASAEDSGGVLEFYNPYLFDSARFGTAIVTLNRDLSAPMAYAVEHASRNYLEGFLDPRDADVKPKLWCWEPYQPGKIPLVLIHGLYSDPSSWADLVNGLCAQPEFYRQYQIWFYGYPTGGAVLDSAAKLREQMEVARELFDPVHHDKSLERVILVGHSMGGLMAQLQVTHSSDILWRQAAKQPLEAVRATPQMQKRLEDDFFFDPSPLVSRVVFIGTPHHGSSMARRVIGRAASNLVKSLGSEEEEYRQLMDANPDFFYEYIQRSPPTSVDLLEPANPFLEALACMPVSRRVELHSIIGTGGSVLAGEPGDGVVPVSSAHLDGVCSELIVPVRHEKLHHDEATLAELSRILREHSCQFGR
jgi:pimeloyl-ACP methyl ester carboxylesterase